VRIQGSQNSLTNGVVNAKWRAGISTCVSINPISRACIENRVREHRHIRAGMEAERRSDKVTPDIS